MPSELEVLSQTISSASYELGSPFLFHSTLTSKLLFSMVSSRLEKFGIGVAVGVGVRVGVGVGVGVGVAVGIGVGVGVTVGVGVSVGVGVGVGVGEGTDCPVKLSSVIRWHAESAVNKLPTLFTAMSRRAGSLPPQPS